MFNCVFVIRFFVFFGKFICFILGILLYVVIFDVLVLKIFFIKSDGFMRFIFEV